MSESAAPDSRTLAIVNGRLVLPDRLVTNTTLLITDGKISGFEPGSPSIPPGWLLVDAGGRLITPGLIDIHTHGAVGYTFNQPSAAAWQTITDENARHGVTTVLATLAAAPLEEMLDCLALARAWKRERHTGTAILGIHAEGPYLNAAQKGAMNEAYLRVAADGSPARFLDYADVLTMMTLAPELPGGLELTRSLAQSGIVPSAGHSSARDTDVLAAVAAGLSHTVHIWSSQSSVIREGPWRKPGLLESSLAFEQLSGEIIADNRHLPATLMKLAYRCKGPDNLCAVSDATLAAGWPENTRFEFGGLACQVRGGVAMLMDNTSFAGSTTLLNQMIPVLVNEVKIPLAEAVRMTTLTPA